MCQVGISEGLFTKVSSSVLPIKDEVDVDADTGQGHLPV